MPPIPSRPGTPSRKLKKKRGDGYESDGGYVSDAKPRKSKVKGKEGKDKDKDGNGEEGTKEKEKEGKEDKKDRKREQKELEKEERKRKKSLVAAEKKEKAAKKSTSPATLLALPSPDSFPIPAPTPSPPGAGYETDGGGGGGFSLSLGKKAKKAKSSTNLKSSSSTPPTAAPEEYESDGGYLSSTPGKKKKGRFGFKLGGKGKGDAKGDGGEGEPSMPLGANEKRQEERPPMPLPIAERFATTLGRTETPLGTSSPALAAASSSTTTSSYLPSLISSSSSASSPSHALAFSSSSSGFTPLSSPNPSTAPPSVYASSPAPHSRLPVAAAGRPDSLGSGSVESAVGMDSGGSSSYYVSGSTARTSESAGTRMSGGSPTSHHHPPKRVGVHFSPTREEMGADEARIKGEKKLHGEKEKGLGHGNGEGSHSTITSAHSIASAFGFARRGVSPASSSGGSVSGRNTGRPSSSSSPTSTSNGKFPAISFPITRAVSPGPASASPTTPSGGLGASPQRVDKAEVGGGRRPALTLAPNANAPIRSRAPSPSPGPGSPYVMVTPINPTHPSSPVPPSPRPRFASQSQSSSPVPLQRSLSTHGGLSPTPSYHAQKPSHLTIDPSSEHTASSTRNSPLPSPNVLAYYDLPPPSPPPAGPLPRVPPVTGAALTLRLGARERIRATRAESQAMAHGQGQGKGDTLPALGVPHSSIQRGRESPFPSRPILPGGNSRESAVVPGLEQRVKVRRYRDLYAIDAPPGGWANLPPRGKEEIQWDGERTPEIDVVEPTESGSMWDKEAAYAGYEEDDPYNEDEEELRDVLDRFEDTSSEGHSLTHSAESTGSSGRQKRTRFALADDRSTMYTIEGAEGGGRNSRWSGSIYSRASVLDPDKSEEARVRFVQRVEAMLDSEGRGERAIPPVPKIPEGFSGRKMNERGAGATTATTTPGRSWNRF
ncbi:hypothetical protein BDQ12DRAFT_683807 [Crucibulum laeve]|uniref:Uncharacterized protein n=1 Tax=Crucibulum laeve TaxID=68775 RepID=A0A5C3LZJ9_9AGAR|nr:hypothetical protein BDQ12DRAFT_683807 [Crucibulum laeve]